MRKGMTRAIRQYRFMAAILSVFLLHGSLPVPSMGEDGTIGFGTDVGVWTGTTDDSDFALAFHFDYYFDPAFSLGPMVLFTPTSDLTQIGFAPVAKYRVNLGRLNLVPFAGFGFVHASLDRGAGANRIDRNDTSFLIPLGLTVEIPVSRKISLASTLIFHLHDIKLNPPVERDRSSISLLFGFRFGP